VTVPNAGPNYTIWARKKIAFTRKKIFVKIKILLKILKTVLVILYIGIEIEFVKSIMLTTKQIISILEELNDNEDKFVSIFNKIVKTGLRIQQNSEELLNECKRLFKNHDSAFQFTFTDFDFSFFLKIVGGTMTYGQGVYQEQDVPLVVIDFPKDIINKVVVREISVESLYNKGVIKLKGSLSNAMRLRALGKHYVKFMEVLFN